MTLRNILNFRALVMLHKIITTKKPAYLFEKLTFRKSPGLNTINQIKFKFSSSEHQFYMYTISLWNSLPNKIRIITSASQFRIELKKYYSEGQ